MFAPPSPETTRCVVGDYMHTQKGTVFSGLSASVLLLVSASAVWPGAGLKSETEFRKHQLVRGYPVRFVSTVMLVCTYTSFDRLSPTQYT